MIYLALVENKQKKIVLKKFFSERKKATDFFKKWYDIPDRNDCTASLYILADSFSGNPVGPPRIINGGIDFSEGTIIWPKGVKGE